MYVAFEIALHIFLSCRVYFMLWFNTTFCYHSISFDLICLDRDKTTGDTFISPGLVIRTCRILSLIATK